MKHSGNTIGDILSEKMKAEVITSAVNEGDVYRMCLDERERIIGKNGAESRNKYFVIIGHDSDGDALGFFVIDTEINKNLPEIRKQKHLRIESSKYDFLNGTDRYVDCSDFKIISKHRLVELFSSDKAKAKISSDDIEKIKHEAITYRNANRKMLKRFGLL